MHMGIDIVITKENFRRRGGWEKAVCHRFRSSHFNTGMATKVGPNGQKVCLRDRCKKYRDL
jgi:hypothetical protein